jgi:hypothetical protein
VLLCNLAQMQGRAGQTVQASHHERVFFPDVFQAVVESRPMTRRPTVFVLEDFVAVPQLVHLDVRALADGTHPRIANKCHIPVSVARRVRPYKKGIMDHKIAHVNGNVSRSALSEAHRG